MDRDGHADYKHMTTAARVSTHHHSTMLSLGLTGGRRHFFALMHFASTGS
jgi:hypothetical protein